MGLFNIKKIIVHNIGNKVYLVVIGEILKSHAINFKYETQNYLYDKGQIFTLQ